MPPEDAGRRDTLSRPAFRFRCQQASTSRTCQLRSRDRVLTQSEPPPIRSGHTMQKLILVNHQSPGDVVMLTAAVRDLDRCHPNRFLTDVHTGSPELWENNPHLTPLDIDDPDARVLECHYPLVHLANER